MTPRLARSGRCAIAESLVLTLTLMGAPVGASAERDAPARDGHGPACTAAMFPEQPGAGLARFQDPKTERFGYRDRSGRVVIPARFSRAYEFNDDGVAAAIEPPRRGHARLVFIDRKGRTLAEAFSSDNGPDYFVDDHARIVRGGKVGFIDRRGQIVVSPAFDFADSLCRGRAVVCVGCARTPGVDEYAEWVGGRWGVIDQVGRYVIPLAEGRIEAAPDASSFTRERPGGPVRLGRDGQPLPAGGAR